MSDTILAFLLSLSTNPAYLFPVSFWVLSAFRIAKRRGMSTANYQDEVLESLLSTMIEQVGEGQLAPLLEESHAPALPHNRFISDLIEGLILNAPTVEAKLALLSEISRDLTNHGVNSEFYMQALNILHQWI